MKLVNQINTTGGQIKVEIQKFHIGEWDSSGETDGLPYVKGIVKFRSRIVGTFETIGGDIRVIGPINRMLKSGMTTKNGLEIGTDMVECLVCDLLVDLII